MGIHGQWAEQEFGGAKLCDTRRTTRAVAMVKTMARRPGGQISAVFTKGATREAAYRFVRNDDIEAGALSRSALEATVTRSFGEATVFVPVDATSFNLSDPQGRRGMGAIGTHGIGAQGVHLMSGIAVTVRGVPLGMCGQRYWTRHERVGLKRDDYDARDVCQKETRYWLQIIEQVGAAYEQSATCPFFQLDRGGDAWPILRYAADHDVMLTTRATHNRRVIVEGRKKLLWKAVAAVEPQASYVLDVPQGHNRRARQACIYIQYLPLEVDTVDRKSGQHQRLPMWAVRVREFGTTPAGEEPIEWMLLTRYPVHTLQDAIFVVDGYATRWRIEEFHKTFKSGACKLEESLLHRRENFERFAVLSSSVAIHLQRLLHLSRTSPDEPATVALTRYEIDATIALRQPTGFKPGDTPPLSLVVRWIADVGGFMGNKQETIRKALDQGKSVRQPGAIVLRRGLERIIVAADLLADGIFKL